jgi:hypothetical protein
LLTLLFSEVNVFTLHQAKLRFRGEALNLKTEVAIMCCPVRALYSSRSGNTRVFKRYSNLCTGLFRPRVFQEAEAPRV